jgi:hypothetical protein
VIVSDAVARGAGWACAAGYAKYVPKMIMGFVRRGGALAWADRIGAGRWTPPDRPNSPTRPAQLTPGGSADSTGGIITEAAHMIGKLSQQSGSGGE